MHVYFLFLQHRESYEGLKFDERAESDIETLL